MDKNITFSVKTDTAVTFKYTPDHWKWYEQETLNEQYHHAKFDIYHIYAAWENPNDTVFNKPRHVTDQKHVNYLPSSWTHSRVA